MGQTRGYDLGVRDAIDTIHSFDTIEDSRLNANRKDCDATIWMYLTAFLRKWQV
jgi:hypothetical protein